MTDPATNPENINKKLSRRHMLRNAAITATGVALLPPFLTGCTKENWDLVKGNLGKGGLGGEPATEELTTEELISAGQNLARMRAWLLELNNQNNAYIFIVYTNLKGAKEAPRKWSDILVDTFFTIGEKILGVVTADIPGAGAALAWGAEQLKSWAAAQKEGKSVDATISDFANGYQEMMIKVKDNLLDLESSRDNYANLRKAFENGPVVFNRKQYTIHDLATSHFPSVDGPDDTEDYKALLAAAYLRFRKYIWNAILVKTANMYYSWGWTEIPAKQSPARYARAEHYPNYPATYLRGKWNPDLSSGRFATGGFDYYYFHLEVDGRVLSDEAAKILFMDDSPGNNINPEGLFPRDYVFKQFHREKPDYFGYLDVRRDLNFYDYGTDRRNNFDLQSDNYVFTGGDLRS
jgi:hypothetical protein